ncbi:MAG: asparagine synthase [Phycisphaerales bacterium]|jgi:asparagine synthase (glutamine-hydrolysing)|nr:asparagine synthase [Phycisphaerales bacterium]
MCGIAVILPGSAVEVPPFAIARMTAALAHRGPDAQAVVRLPGCHLGHTRLSIIDLAGGGQPMGDPSGRFHIVFNGEIYNYRGLRRELEAEGCAFRTHSDTEVLLQGYLRHGDRILPRLNGQFTFAIWDSAERVLFTARDRFGEKPLYWARSASGDVVIASEIKAILASGLIAPRIDPVSVDAYLGLFYVPPGRSIYANVHPLSPAHAMKWSGGEATTDCYWRPRFGGSGISEPEAVEQIRTLLTRAVRRQMVADVPVGAFLSGGLDSSTIVALMSRESSQPAQTYAVGFGDLINELPFAREVARACHSDHHELQMDIDVPAMLSAMADVYDEPLADSSNIPTYLVAEYARRHVKVVLSGDGGDEIFGGYDWYTKLLDARPDGDWWENHVASASGLLFDRSALWGDGRQPPAAAAVREVYRPGAYVAGMDRASHFDVACYLAGDILMKVDRAAMAHGLETRAPFLDADLADFVLGLPWQMRFQGGRLKHLLREACEDLWPASVRGRGKQGFGAPVRHWLENPEVGAMWDRVTRPDSPLLALLPGLPKVAPELRPQRKWSLLCLGLWLERRGECLAKLP